MLKEVEDHKPVHESLNKAGNVLLELCMEDITVIEEEIQDENQRWNKLQEGLKDKEQKVDRLSDQLQKYQKALQAVDEKVNQVETKADLPFQTVSDLGKVKQHVQDLKDLKDQLAAVKPDIDKALEAGQRLLDNNKDVDTTAIQHENENMQEHFAQVDSKIDEKLKNAEALLDNLEQYWEQEDKLDREMKNVGEELEANKPKVMELDKIKDQLEKAKVLFSFFFLPCAVKISVTYCRSILCAIETEMALFQFTKKRYQTLPSVD